MSFTSSPSRSAVAAGAEVLDPDRDRWFLGTLVRIRAAAGDTAGRLGLFEQEAGRGSRRRRNCPRLRRPHRRDQ